MFNNDLLIYISGIFECLSKGFKRTAKLNAVFELRK